MSAPNPSTLWAETFVDELARAGLNAAVVAPGSRSTPLTLAFAHHPNITVYSLLDERGAAFFALGLAVAAGRPAALVCTSGTAVANFYPAIIEANNALVPLLVLTTDRPPELRHSGANQTIDQIKLYGDQVRWFVDVALPQNDPPATLQRSLRTLACRALAATQGLTPGPVHLNFPFRKPLEPTPVAHMELDEIKGRPGSGPFTHMSRGSLTPSAEQVDLLTKAIQRTARGLIVCGPRCPGNGFPQAVCQLAHHSGYPILADALSGVRFGPHLSTEDTAILGGYETYLRPEITAHWEPPELILRFGAAPISKALNDYLAAHTGCRHIQISGTGVWQDDTHTTTDFLWADPIAACSAVTYRLERKRPSSRTETWRAAFQQAEGQTWQAIELARNHDFFEGAILAEVVDLMPPEALLFVASSNPVRHLDQFGRPHRHPLRVFANRGASGIDGTVACALGAAAAGKLPLVLVIGDLAFYHDMNSLLALQRCGLKATIVLINNNGGGIFHRLPIANFDPPFTELFITPHGLDFEPAAKMFGAEYNRASTLDTFRRVFQESVGSDTATVIEVPTDSAHYEHRRREIIQTVTRQLVQSE